MQSAVSEATGFVHYARAARFFPQVRFGIKVSEPVRQSGRGRGSPGWIGRAGVQGRGSAARTCKGGEARRRNGIAGGAFAASQAQPEGDAGESGCGAACKGEGGAPWKRDRGGRSCRPARHSPKGQCRGRGARRGRRVWEKRRAMEAGLRRRSCRFARHSPKGTQESGCAARHAREGKRVMEAGLREAALAAPQGTARRGRRGERVRRGVQGRGRRAMEAGLREAAFAAL